MAYVHVGIAKFGLLPTPLLVFMVLKLKKIYIYVYVSLKNAFFLKPLKIVFDCLPTLVSSMIYICQLSYSKTRSEISLKLKMQSLWL